MNSEILDKVFDIIEKRKMTMAEGSYTVTLLKKGLNEILKKIGEETTELVMASVSGKRKEIIHETADLFYHIMVLLVSKDIHIKNIYHELKNRMGISGIEEKQSREKNG